MCKTQRKISTIFRLIFSRHVFTDVSKNRCKFPPKYVKFMFYSFHVCLFVCYLHVKRRFRKCFYIPKEDDHNTFLLQLCNELVMKSHVYAFDCVVCVSVGAKFFFRPFTKLTSTTFCWGRTIYNVKCCFHVIKATAFNFKLSPYKKLVDIFLYVMAFSAFKLKQVESWTRSTLKTIFIRLLRVCNAGCAW